MKKIWAVVVWIAFVIGCNQNSSKTFDIDKAKVAQAKADGFGFFSICYELDEPADCDLCEIYDWYGDGYCDLFCILADSDCEETNEESCLSLYKQISQAYDTTTLVNRKEI